MGIGFGESSPFRPQDSGEWNMIIYPDRCKTWGIDDGTMDEDGDDDDDDGDDDDG